MRWEPLPSYLTRYAFIGFGKSVPLFHLYVSASTHAFIADLCFSLSVLSDYFSLFFLRFLTV